MKCTSHAYTSKKFKRIGYQKKRGCDKKMCVCYDFVIFVAGGGVFFVGDAAHRVDC